MTTTAQQIEVTVAAAEWTNGVDLDGAARYEKNVGHGVKDAQGRMIGSAASVRVLACEDRRYVANVQGTRNGKSYGALQPNKRFDTLAAAQAHCDAKIQGALKRTLVKK